MALDRYKLTVVGSGGSSVTSGSNLGVLCAKARDLAERGYTACIKNAQGSVAEVRKDRDTQRLSVLFRRAPQDPAGIDDAEPQWVGAVRNAIDH